ncbi:MAG: isoamylase early set domain-containing protein [Gemmatimonadaceae bacterium]
MSDEHDEMIDRIAGVLRPLPQVDDSARARVLVAVAAERERVREEELRRDLVRRGGRTRWVVAIAGVAAAAMVGALLLREPQPTASTAVAPSSASTQTDARFAAVDGSDADVARQPVQLVFRAPSAASVRVVGDFNAWDKERAPMTRDAESGLWSVTLSLRPGRHVYAFVVDDTLWMRDPRATAAPDADFGRPGSVLLVGRP